MHFYANVTCLPLHAAFPLEARVVANTGHPSSAPPFPHHSPVPTPCTPLHLPPHPNPHTLPVTHRKKQLLLHLHSSRQSLLRILALLNWKGWKVLAELVDHERVMDIAASHVRTISQVRHACMHDSRVGVGGE